MLSTREATASSATQHDGSGHLLVDRFSFERFPFKRLPFDRQSFDGASLHYLILRRRLRQFRHRRRERAQAADENQRIGQLQQLVVERDR